MNGVTNILADTNLIIFAIGGDARARQLLEGNNLFISVITEMELLSIPFRTLQDEKIMIDFISNCFVIDLDTDVKKQAILLRKKQKIKLPDAIIAASSITKKLPLFTGDKGFSKIEGLNVVLF